MHQVILNTLVTKDIDNKVFDCIYLWHETLVSISWAIRASYHLTIGYIMFQYVFVVYMILNLASVIYWRFITAKKQ